MQKRSHQEQEVRYKTAKTKEITTFMGEIL